MSRVGLLPGSTRVTNIFLVKNVGTSISASYDIPETKWVMAQTQIKSI